MSALSSINNSDPNCMNCLADFTSKEKERPVYPVKPGTCKHMICTECYEKAIKYDTNPTNQDKKCPVSECLKGRFISIQKDSDYDGLNESELALHFMAGIVSINIKSINRMIKSLIRQQVEITRKNEEHATLENTRNNLLREVERKRRKEEYLNEFCRCMIEKSIIPTVTFEEYFSEHDLSSPSLESYKSYQVSNSVPFTLPCQTQEILSSVFGNISILTIKEDLSSLIGRVRMSSDPALEYALIIIEFSRILPQLEKVNLDLIYRSEYVQTVTSNLSQSIYMVGKEINNTTLEVQRRDRTISGLECIILDHKRRLVNARNQRPEHEVAHPIPLPFPQPVPMYVGSVPFPHFVSTPVQKPSSSIYPPSMSKESSPPPKNAPSMYKANALAVSERTMKFSEIPAYDEKSRKEIDWAMSEVQIAECLKALKPGFNEYMPLTVTGLMELIKAKYSDTTLSEFAEALKKSGITPENYKKLLKRTADRIWKHKNYLRDRESGELAGTSYSSSQSGLLSYACHFDR